MLASASRMAKSLIKPLLCMFYVYYNLYLAKIRVQKYKFFLINEVSHNYFLILHTSNGNIPVRKRLLSIWLFLLVALPRLQAQTDSLLREGDRLHREYRFEEAMERFARASALTADPDTLRLLRNRMDCSQNALNMTDFCADPVVVARERFSRRDFFLFYPLKNQGWRAAPNVLDTSGDAGYPVYAPKGVRSVCFSAPDATGARNIYLTRDRDTLWSAPQLMDEHLLSMGNEVFPMLSEDGKTLTFASDGLHGMGGYDLYTSTWDDASGTWGEPVNLGIPFNSPGDDLLLVDSPDGHYTLFASNRDCPADSVYIYVVEKQMVPARTPMRDPEALARIAALDPLQDPARQDHGAAVEKEVPQNDDTRLYQRIMAETRALRDSIYACERRLDTLRMRLSAGIAEDRTALTSAIADREAALSPLRTRLEESNRTVRSIEQSFLRRGVVAESDRADRELVGARSSYTFSKKAWGAKLRMKVAAAPKAAEPGFRIAPMGRFAQDTSLPQGIVYQILLFTSSRHARLDEIGGLDPVYERLTSTLRYTYSVGLFRSFQEALLQLNAIRALGFPEAEVTAFLDGKPVSVTLARRAE